MKLLRVGLTGGYATGKSFVASELSRHGCHLIYTDKLGHQVLMPGNEAYHPAIALLGEAMLMPDGSLDRRKIGQLVFNDANLLQRLNEIVHPAVYRLEAALIDEIASRQPDAIVVTEAAILVETGRYKTFDKLIVTVCSEPAQIVRGMGRDRVSMEEAKRRIAAQMPVEEKKKYAHYIVDTDGSKQKTREHVAMIYAELCLLTKAAQ